MTVLKPLADSCRQLDPLWALDHVEEYDIRIVQGGEGVLPRIDVTFLTLAVNKYPTAAVRDGLDVLDASPHDLDPP